MKHSWHETPLDIRFGLITLMGMASMNSYSCLQALLDTLHIEETLKSWQIIGQSDMLGTVVVKMQLVPFINDTGRGMHNDTSSLSELREGITDIETRSNDDRISYSNYSLTIESETYSSMNMLSI